MRSTSIILTFLILILSYTEISAQNISSNKGFDDVYIGMSSTDLVSVMGRPTRIVPYSEEEKAWLDAGYVLSTKIVFHIGFDHVYKYNDDNDHGLWKAYMKDDKIVYMTVTSYNAFAEASEKITVNKTIRFGDSIEKVIEIMGDDYVKKVDERDNIEIIYIDEGLRFIFTSEELNHVYIFGHLPKSAEYLFRNKF